MKRKIAILGSTGSIGTQALDVISRHPDLLCAEVLTANSNWELLVEQAIKYKVNAVVIANESKYEQVFKALDAHDIKVFTGKDSIGSLASANNIDIVLTAIVGFSGLQPTVEAIKAGKVIALANKETLVAAGSIIMELAKKHNAPIIPVDSEHSAIFQCLQGEHANLEKILLTASGGPFFSKTKQEMENATIKDALNHPKWNMGSKVSIDSATMMNKGFEMIEAHWLFGTQPSNIEIVVHPQSIIHSMVQFTDGSVTAQLSYPDMRLPIQYALTYPQRVSLNTERINFTTLSKLDFFKPDFKKFPSLNIAYQAIERGGNIPCAMNAANEAAVKSFLDGKIKFTQIAQIIEETINETSFIKEPSLEDIFETNTIAYDFAIKLCNTHKKQSS